MRPVALLFPVLSVCLLLSGCATTQLPSSAASAPEITSGSVHGGQQPIGGAALTIFAAGTSGYGSSTTALTSATAGATGNFSIAAPDCTAAGGNATLYILAAGGNSGRGINRNIMLGAALGPCSAGLPRFIAINEVTTAAMAFGMGQFFTPNLGGTSAATDSFGSAPGLPLPLANAAGATVPLLVNGATGRANDTATAGALTTTLEPAKLYSIANTLAACVNTDGVGGASSNCANLFAYTTPPGTGMLAPSDTLQAAVEMSRLPWQNVAQLYALASGSGAPYIGLPVAPNDWTLAASYTSTSFGLTIAGSADSGTSSTIDIDSAGNVWFPSNTPSAHGLGVWSPAIGTFSGPYATGLISPQYVAIDNGGTVWASDTAAGQVLGVTASSPTTATAFTITAAGTDATGPLTVAPAYTASQVSGFGLSVVTDSAGTPGVSSFSGTKFVSSAALSGLVTAVAGTQADATQTIVSTAGNGPSAPCVLGQAVTNNAFSGPLQSAPPCQSGGALSTFNMFDTLMIATIGGSDSVICSQRTNSCFTAPAPLHLPQGAAIDGDSNIWVANSQPANASVSTFADLRNATGKVSDYVQTSPVAYLHGPGQGSSMTAPYGLAIDGAGNVWISNAGCVTASACATPSSFTLSELIGAAAPTRTPLSAQNATPSSGNTVGTRP